MRIFLAENGLKTGPFLPWEVRSRIERGEVNLDTLGWHEGCEEWVPLRDLPALGMAARDLPGGEEVAGTGGGPSMSSPVAVAGATSGMDARARPWHRFAARMFDLIFWFTVMALAMEPFGGGFANVLTQPAWIVGSQLLMVVAEATCLTLFGATPGKALLGLRVVAKGGSLAPMAFSPALQRALLVYAVGSPTYLPVYITVCAWIFHHVNLTKLGASWWDRRLGSEVLGTPVTWRRILVFCLCFIALEAVLNIVAGDEMKPLLDAMMNGQG